MIVIYFTFIYLILSLSYRGSFINFGEFLSREPSKLLSLAFNKAGNFINTGFNGLLKAIFNNNKNLVLEIGTFDMLSIISVIFFFVLGFINEESSIVSLNLNILAIVIFETLIVTFANKGRILSISLLSIVSICLGHYLNRLRTKNKELLLYKKNLTEQII